MRAILAQQAFDGERLLTDRTVVLIDGARIVAVQSEDVALPRGCAVDANPTATVLPGLIDGHVHLCCDSDVNALERLADISDDAMTQVIAAGLDAQAAVGVTTVRDLGDRRYAVIDWRDRTDRGEPRPTVIASGPPITTPDGHCSNMGGGVKGIVALRRAVRERAERGVDVVKIMASGGVNTPGTDPSLPQFTVDEIAAVVEEAHALGLPVTAHAHALTAIRNALDAQVDGIEHCTFVTDSGVQVDPDVIATLVAAGVPVCPTLGFAPTASPPPAVLEFFRKAGISHEQRIQVVTAMHAAGVRIVAGADSGINPGKHHGVLPESLIQLSEGGIPATDVLASATQVAADVCRLADRKGRLAAGLDADLLVVEGNPFADITALRNVSAVYLRGHRLGSAGL